jgi:N-acetylglucosamine kinase-like BadF-type ATPase
MSKTLVVESGSTKSDWVVLENGKSKLQFQSKGWNPLFMNAEDMIRRLNSYHDLMPFRESIGHVYFYAPGCSCKASKDVLKEVLEGVFINAVVESESDLLAAARSTFIDKPLFVSILGTGSNTAFYDGEIIEPLNPSLGYILGDEGSGASLGKVILKAYLYKKLPVDLYTEFSKEYSISTDLVLRSVYRQENPNRFLASYVPFLVKHKTSTFVKELVGKEFEDYLQTHLMSNPMKVDFSIAFVGSVAFYFQDLLSELCLQKNISISRIVKSPIQGLIDFHTNTPSRF